MTAGLQEVSHDHPFPCLPLPGRSSHRAVHEAAYGRARARACCPLSGLSQTGLRPASPMPRDALAPRSQWAVDLRVARDFRCRAGMLGRRGNHTSVLQAPVLQAPPWRRPFLPVTPALPIRARLATAA